MNMGEEIKMEDIIAAINEDRTDKEEWNNN